KHTFIFDQYSGALSFDSEQPEKSHVRFVVETASVRRIDDWVKPNQIKDIEKAAKDLMAADRYGQMTFQSTAIHGEIIWPVRGPGCSDSWRRSNSVCP